MFPDQRLPSDPIGPPAAMQQPQSTSTRVEVHATKKPQPKEDHAELLELAHERFRIITSAESEWRKNAVDELNFADALQHWTQEMKDERQGRPCMVFDRIGPAIGQTVNDA